MKKNIIIDVPGDYEYRYDLIQEGEEVEVVGIIRAEIEGEYVLRIGVNHRGRKTKGRVKIRGIVERGASVKVDGLVRIEKEADEADDVLDMKVLLLDDKAEAEVDPKMEILANNVKAAHAASVGRIDEEQLFYLQSRGLDRQEAEKLIIRGFLEVK